MHGSMVWMVSASLLAAAGPVASAEEAAPVFPLKISVDGRYLIDRRGTPFPVIGDSPWSLIVEPTPAEADRYLDDRKAKGFTMLLINLIEHKFSSRAPAKKDGAPPFAAPGDFSTPNEAYFRYAEEVVRKAARRGLAVLLCPAYLGYGGGDEGFFQEMLKNGPEKIRAYGRYVGRRFRDHANIVWIVGGDFTPPSEHRWTVDEVAAGIREEDKNHLMTVHNAPETPPVSVYGDQPWLDMNNVYSYRPDLYTACYTEDSRSPRLPYFLAETAYEGEHDSAPERIRRQAYWPFLSGAFGQLYGNSPMWHFGSFRERAGDWKAALNSTGAKDIARLSAFLRKRKWWLLRPDRSHTLVTGGFGTPGEMDYVAAARAEDGSLALAYIPSGGTEGRSLTVNMGELASRVAARWFSPATGRFVDLPGSPFPNSGTQALTSPGDNGTGASDWLLVLEARQRR
ncbi:MAG: glycoside hydrolase family 140 protein [Armatimonadetes bacterium]|nr:glycoside hydrolase family 140 protein [Armatimonadota bacterium]